MNLERNEESKKKNTRMIESVSESINVDTGYTRK